MTEQRPQPPGRSGGRRLSRRALLAAGLTLPVLAGASAVLLPRVTELPLGEPPPVPGPSNRLVLDGRPSFWAGVNYPWKTGQDFGTGGWGHSGVSDPTTYQEIDVDFTNMAAQGVRVVKWRVFSDARYGLQVDDNRVVTGLDAFLLPDLDAALEIATRHDLYLVLTLFSSGLWTADCSRGSVHLGGHAQTLLDPRRRQALVDQAIAPVLHHLATADRVLAIEVIAEPEWGIQELNQDQDARIKLPLAPVRDFVAEVTRAIHRETHALATVESNRFSNMPSWRDLHLDYYSFSWYDWLEPYEPLATPASAVALDRPIVLGEYPAGTSAYYDLPAVLDVANAAGYAGAFAWSYWTGDGLSDWRAAAPGFSDWMRQHWDEANLGGSASPPAPGPIAEQRYPYAYQDFALRVDGGDVVAEMKIDVASGEPYVPHAYLYHLGSTEPLQDVLLAADPGKPGLLAARFANIDANTPYSISLGIFSRTDQLRKWFNAMASFAVTNGALTTPSVDTLANELGCPA